MLYFEHIFPWVKYRLDCQITFKLEELGGNFPNWPDSGPYGEYIKLLKLVNGECNPLYHGMFGEKALAENEIAIAEIFPHLSKGTLIAYLRSDDVKRIGLNDIVDVAGKIIIQDDSDSNAVDEFLPIKSESWRLNLLTDYFLKDVFPFERDDIAVISFLREQVYKIFPQPEAKEVRFSTYAGKVFIDAENTITTPTQNKVVRKTKYDWPAFHAEVCSYILNNKGKLPQKKTALEHHMTQWCQKEKWPSIPSHGSLQPQLSQYYDKIPLERDS